MARRIVAALARALSNTHEEPVHIHAGAHGRQYVCDDPNCTSPSM